MHWNRKEISWFSPETVMILCLRSTKMLRVSLSVGWEAPGRLAPRPLLSYPCERSKIKSLANQSHLAITLMLLSLHMSKSCQFPVFWSHASHNKLIGSLRAGLWAHHCHIPAQSSTFLQTLSQQNICNKTALRQCTPFQQW